MATDELETIEYGIEIAGKQVRGLLLDQQDVHFYETTTTRDLAIPPYQVRAEDITIGTVVPFMKPLRIARGLDEAGKVDMRFIPRASKFINGAWQQQDTLGPQQAAYWRAADQSRHALLAAEPSPKLHVEDLQLSQGYAFAVIQRAGVDRTDLVDLEIAEDT